MCRGRSRQIPQAPIKSHTDSRRAYGIAHVARACITAPKIALWAAAIKPEHLQALQDFLSWRAFLQPAPSSKGVPRKIGSSLACAWLPPDFASATSATSTASSTWTASVGDRRRAGLIRAASGRERAGVGARPPSLPARSPSSACLLPVPPPRAPANPTHLDPTHLDPTHLNGQCRNRLRPLPARANRPPLLLLLPPRRPPRRPPAKRRKRMQLP